jgi:hypothetical protein
MKPQQRPRGRRRYGPLRPTPRQERYLRAVLEAAVAGKILSQKDFAQIAGVSEKTVCAWMHDSDFNLAVESAFGQGFRQSLRLRAELAAMGRAVRGSVEDWRLHSRLAAPRLGVGPARVWHREDNQFLATSPSPQWRTHHERPVTRRTGLPTRRLLPGQFHPESRIPP